MSNELNDLGLGRMTLAHSEDEIEYQPYEVSRNSLGIIARSGLPKGLHVTISSFQGMIKLEVVDSCSKGVPDAQERYSLNAARFNKIDLESLFADSGCYERINHLKATGAFEDFQQFRNARFDKGPNVTVVAQTFGTAFHYQFRAKDISRSGMQIISERDVLVPFSSNTLLEVTIDPEQEWLKAPIHCVAKVIRRAPVSGQGQRASFGVHFIELGEETQRLWRSLVDVADTVQTKVSQMAA